MEREINYKWIVYLTTNVKNNKIYVGVHKTKDPNKFDGYIGCGININQPYTYKNPKTAFQYAVVEYGLEAFRRQTIQICDDPETAYDLEFNIVNEEFLKRPDVYNMILGGEYIIPPKVKVYQYDLKGNYITEYSSIQEAAQKNNVTYGAIDHAVNRKQKSCNSFWSTDKLDKLDLSLYNLGLNHRVPVFVYDCLGNFLESYDSEQQCAKGLGVHINTIRQAYLLDCLVKQRWKVSTILATTYSEANTIYCNSRMIYQYDSNGEFLAEYKQIEAIKKFPHNNIVKALKQKKPDKDGYLWGLVKLNNYFTTNKSKCKKVGKYNLDGNLVKEYSSATEAAKENGTAVWKVLSDTNKTHKQHIYKYL